MVMPMSSAPSSPFSFTFTGGFFVTALGVSCLSDGQNLQRLCGIFNTYTLINEKSIKVSFTPVHSRCDLISAPVINTVSSDFEVWMPIFVAQSRMRWSKATWTAAELSLVIDSGETVTIL
jgi:hypothetical protein